MKDVTTSHGEDFCALEQSLRVLSVHNEASVLRTIFVRTSQSFARSWYCMQPLMNTRIFFLRTAYSKSTMTRATRMMGISEVMGPTLKEN